MPPGAHVMGDRPGRRAYELVKMVMNILSVLRGVNTQGSDEPKVPAS